MTEDHVLSTYLMTAPVKPIPIFCISLVETEMWRLIMTAIPQLLRNARRKVLRYSFNLMLSWYEATQFNPTDHHFL
jgi:hypothetical protein